jgi:hypothetical protein
MHLMLVTDHPQPSAICNTFTSAPVLSGAHDVEPTNMIFCSPVEKVTPQTVKVGHTQRTQFSGNISIGATPKTRYQRSQQENPMRKIMMIVAAAVCITAAPLVASTGAEARFGADVIANAAAVPQVEQAQYYYGYRRPRYYAPRYYAPRYYAPRPYYYAPRPYYAPRYYAPRRYYY